MYSTPDFLTISLVCCHWLPSAIYTMLAFGIKGRQSILKIKNQYWRRLDLIFICLLKIARIQFSRYISSTKTHCVVEFDSVNSILNYYTTWFIWFWVVRLDIGILVGKHREFISEKNVIIQIQLKIYFSCEVTHRWL